MSFYGLITLLIYLFQSQGFQNQRPWPLANVNLTDLGFVDSFENVILMQRLR